MQDEIAKIIKRSLPEAQVIVASDDGTHFNAIVISESFEGLSLVKQHQIVMNALKADFDTERLHALQLRTFTPEKWTAQKTGPLPVVSVRHSAGSANALRTMDRDPHARP